MNSIAAIDTVAPNIKDDLAGCIRILLTINNSTNDVKHVYLNDAKTLRLDR
jgi:chorismate mutase